MNLADVCLKRIEKELSKMSTSVTLRERERQVNFI